ncbi:MAG TPA: hypothetical protein VEV83_16990 [Parafilimonas sp.]|nr:hypothetical protein [Parafilimonas sp.]
MPDQRTDKQGFSTVNPDEERDMGAKGGPTTSLGNADNAHDVPHPYDEDTQTQLAAKSTKKEKTAETMNDDWKTGVDKNMEQDKSSDNSMNSGGSSNMNRGSSNYKQTTSSGSSMNSKTSSDMDEE